MGVNQDHLHSSVIRPSIDRSWKKFRAFEFAAINPGLWGKKYRFAYGLGFPTGYLVIIMNTAIVTIITITTSINTIINPHLFCFAYNIGFPTEYLVIIINTALITHITTQCGSIHKLDVEKKEFTAHWEDKACRATEPQFVPR